MTEPQARIAAALELAFKYGQIDGAHHRVWVIDQMVRTLIGDDVEYRSQIAEYCLDGAYEWDEGIAP